MNEIVNTTPGVTGISSYKGYTAQQHNDVYGVFEEFLNDIRPTNVLEIGSGGCGFILFIRDTLNKIGLHSSTVGTIDIKPDYWHDEIREHDVHIDIVNVFNPEYDIILKPEVIVPYIEREGVTLVLCDGGNKKQEFNLISPHIKVGDYIMAHDYVDTEDNYIKNYYGKIWNWPEVYDRDLIERDDLVSYNKDKFDRVVWVCKKKI